MQKLIRTLGFATLAISLAGCHIVYTPDVAQGNLFDKTIDKNLADQLKPGLTKRQVLVLMGTPSVASPFDQNRWDYVSTYSHRGEKMTVNTMSLFFNNDTLVRTEGTLYMQDSLNLVKQSNKYKTNYNVNDTSGDKNPDAGSGGDSGSGGGSDSSGGDSSGDSSGGDSGSH
jgi:outer membrane protein assembly factor BamE